MIFRVFKRGLGGGDGPINYLLGGLVCRPDGSLPKLTDADAGQYRRDPPAELLRGDPELLRFSIDNCRFKQRYTSGVLAFAGTDAPTDAQQRELMDECERVMLPGIERDGYQVIWVRHQDKGNTELHFVFSNTHVPTGKRLAPYYHRADGKRMHSWQTAVNAEMGFADPDEPQRRALSRKPRDLPKSQLKLREAVDEFVSAAIDAHLVEDRDDIIELISSELGLKVARKTPKSVSFVVPNSDKNIRFRGALYEQHFRVSGQTRNAVEDAARAFEQVRPERAAAARKRAEDACRARAVANQKRYRTASPILNRDSEREPQSQQGRDGANNPVAAPSPEAAKADHAGNDKRAAQDASPAAQALLGAGHLGNGGHERADADFAVAERLPGQNPADLKKVENNDGNRNPVAGRIREIERQNASAVQNLNAAVKGAGGAARRAVQRRKWGIRRLGSAVIAAARRVDNKFRQLVVGLNGASRRNREENLIFPGP